MKVWTMFASVAAVCAACASPQEPPGLAEANEDRAVKRAVSSTFSAALEAASVVREVDGDAAEDIVRFPAARMDPDEGYCWRIHLAVASDALDPGAPKASDYYEIEQYYTYAINPRGRDCSRVEPAAFFYGEFGGSPRDLQPLRLAEWVLRRSWLARGAAPRVVFPQLTDASPVCLRSRKAPPLRLASLIALNTTEWDGEWDEAAWGRSDGYRFYLFNLEGCEEAGRARLVSLYLAEPLLGAKTILSYKLQDAVEFDDAAPLE